MAAAAEQERGPGANGARRRGCALEKKSSNILAILILSHRGTQAYEEVLSLKRVSGEDDKKEGKGSEKEAKTL